jgi:hypothetical protein
MARGIVAMCSASSLTLTIAIACFAGEGSPSGAKVETEPMKGTRALPAIVIAEVLRRM